jgi:hypothetical protein
MRAKNEADRQFQQILRGHTCPVADLANTLRQLILTAAPTLREQILTGYARYWHKAHVVCAMTVHADHVNLLFYYGTNLNDPDHLLIGTGKRLRHLTFREPRDLRPAYAKRLLKQAISNHDGEPSARPIARHSEKERRS